MICRMYLLLILAAVLAAVNANATGRIVGGYDAEPAQFPHQISLRIDGRHTCGGSIIKTNWVLTAAHCVVDEDFKPMDAERYTVRAGTHNRIAGGVIIQVKQIIVHHGHSGLANDMALLELTDDFVWSKKIQPIELQVEEVPADSDVIISGWGLLVNNGDSLPIILQHNKVKAITRSRCISKILIVPESVICFDHPSGAGACNGDSGGPATYNGKLCGVAGYVVPGCGFSRPDGYASVSYNIEWIREHANL